MREICETKKIKRKKNKKLEVRNYEVNKGMNKHFLYMKYPQNMNVFIYLI